MAELNLRAKTNASVIAIQRHDRYITALSPDERLAEGDVLYLVGDESDVILARNLLASGA
jgi:K+/H+ antiporter YhaU regulatory subunit KhtT